MKLIAAALLVLALTVAPASATPRPHLHVVPPRVCLSHPIGGMRCLSPGETCIVADNPRYQLHGFVCVKAGKTHRLALIVAIPAPRA
jgi:hypothetical protein